MEVRQNLFTRWGAYESIPHIFAYSWRFDFLNCQNIL